MMHTIYNYKRIKVNQAHFMFFFKFPSDKLLTGFFNSCHCLHDGIVPLITLIDIVLPSPYNVITNARIGALPAEVSESCFRNIISFFYISNFTPH